MRLNIVNDKSLQVRVLFTLALSLSVFLVVGFLFVFDDHKRINTHLLNEYSAQRLAGLISVLNNVSPDERKKIVHSLSVLPTTISLSIPWQDQLSGKDSYSISLSKAVLSYLDKKIKLNVVRMKNVPQVILKTLHFENDSKFLMYHEKDKNFSYPRELFIQARLNDGQTVTFHYFLPDNVDPFLFRFTLFVIILSIAILLFTYWSVRRLTKPLDDLSKAAISLGSDMNAPPLPENGPAEVVAASKAFNLMQKKLKKYIETRTQALFAVSHDLRLPLTRIMLQLEGNINSEVKKQISQDLEEMNKMIGHTLDYLRAGQETESFVLLNLNSLLDTLADRMEDLGITIINRAHIEKPIFAQPQALTRCLTNILDNARRYGGDTIWLTTEELPSHVKIIIEDNGNGIPESEFENVFEPYYRVEASRSKNGGGTGLGLAIAKRTIENHNGTITLSSPENKGLIVTIILPFQV
ncbi:ATP-binding protein [Tolumonas lignilytica]|uniref:ATP-binding protein n=1 Tax=Tolumonas lignilytica TaxID=1283284 RepID=UPI0004B79163|nr:ATP-binding protein [Tolumonas lignilytica]